MFPTTPGTSYPKGFAPCRRPPPGDRWLEDGWLECGCCLVEVLRVFWTIVGLTVFWKPVGMTFREFGVPGRCFRNTVGMIFRELGVSGHRFRKSFEVLEVPRTGLGDLWATFGTPGWSLGAPRFIFNEFVKSSWEPWGSNFPPRWCLGPLFFDVCFCNGF